jgi:hypothetical protein
LKILLYLKQNFGDDESESEESEVDDSESEEAEESAKNPQQDKVILKFAPKRIKYLFF